MRLQKVVPPRLPDPAGTYVPGYFQALLNVLRLYFNRLTDNVNNLLGVNGGQFIECPNGLFFSTTDQTAAAVNTGYPIVFETTYLNNAVSIVSSSQVTPTISGVYNIQFNGQLQSTNSSSKVVYIWLVRDGTAIGMSTQAYTLAGSGNYLGIRYNADIDLQAGQYLQVYWATTDTTIELHSTGATSPHPGIPSAFLAANFISPLPDTLPTPP